MKKFYHHKSYKHIYFTQDQLKFDFPYIHNIFDVVFISVVINLNYLLNVDCLH